MVGAILGLFLLAWSALWIPIALLAKLVRRDQEVMLRLARNRWAPGIVRAFSTRFEVRGAGQLDPDQTYLFVANHMSNLDVPVLMCAIPSPVRFFAKQQLRPVPLLGRFIAASGMVFVDRSSPRRARNSMDELTARLRAGQSFVAFPEGRRSRTGRLGAFKLGAFKAAIAAKAVVVPIGLQGSNAIWPAGFRPSRRGPLRVAIGRAYSTAGMAATDAQVLSDAVRLAISDLVSYSQFG